MPASFALLMVWLGSAAAAAPAPALHAGAIRLDVPVLHQAPEQCGPAALRMVLAFHHADAAALADADSAYDPVFRGSLVTDLAARARQAGFEARVTSAPADSLIAWLAAGVPPIVLYPVGFGPLTRQHYAVVTGWEPDRARFVLNDGGSSPREVRLPSLERWRAGSDRRVLIVTPRAVADSGVDKGAAR